MSELSTKDKIKKALLEGGIVYAPRGSGKTTAVAEIIAENPNAVAIFSNDYSRRHMEKILDNMGVLPHGRLLHIMLVKPHDINGKDVYVDEVPAHVLEAMQFKSAVLSHGNSDKAIKVVE